ncbi:hypothetical protein AB0H88_26385 [Nonomuraea sp. NPDC050680]|uniref:hypothetical protein n=1 Tax=Nonomuraea sp. NPDC050680 TaxID=3154630 RepID=UPI0033E42E8E
MMVQDTDVAAYLRAASIRETGFGTFVQRVEAARKNGEFPRGFDPHALAAYFAAVLRDMSEWARDGADVTELRSVAELALAVWPGPTDLKHCSSHSRAAA